MSTKKAILITGGAGFIGRHVVEHFIYSYPNYQCIILDNLTYAGHLKNLDTILNADNCTFIKADINDYQVIDEIIQQYKIQGIIHLAAETHVDNSINTPMSFTKTNIVGTANLIEAVRNYLSQRPTHSLRYLQISTDEVFGSIQYPLSSNEHSPYQPRSPYSASKASADHLVMAYYHTYHFPAMISYCTNNYGSFQHPEKLIPKTIAHALEKKPIPIYGSGQQIRNWIAVQDHVRAIDLIFHHGKLSETYAISAHHEYSNLEIVRKICTYMEKILGYPTHTLTHLITHIGDRPGHDFRYSLNTEKITQQLGWQPIYQFDKYLEATIDWYLENIEWLKK